MTIKQARAFDATLDNGGNVSKAMQTAGYSPAMVKNPQKLTRSQAWQEMMLRHGLTPTKLFKKLNDGLDATDLVMVKKGKKYEQVERADFGNRHKYLDTAFKIAGAYTTPTGGGVHLHLGGKANKYKIG